MLLNKDTTVLSDINDFFTTSEKDIYGDAGRGGLGRQNRPNSPPNNTTMPRDFSLRSK